MHTTADWIGIMRGITRGHVHAGSTDAMVDAGYALVAHLCDWGIIRVGDCLLDVGCGNGRLALGLTEIQLKRYCGVDVIPESIDFCRSAFADYGYEFFHLDVHNAMYNPLGSLLGEDVVFPFADASFDSVVAESLFTHLGTLPVCEHYLSEILRVLRPGGRFYSTWFRSPPNAETSAAQRSVFPEAAIIQLLQPFTVIQTAGGMTTGFHDQWWISARKKEDYV